MNKYQWIVKIIDYIILIGAILLTTNGNFQLAVVIFLYCIYSKIGLIIIRKGANYDRWKIRRRISQNIWRKI